MDEKGIHMDSETKAEFERIEGRLELALQKSIQMAIKEGFREIKDHIAELFNKDIDHINEHLTRHDKYHEEHYGAEKKMWKAIDDLRMNVSIDVDAKLKPVITEIESVKDIQLSFSVSQETADKIEDKIDRKKELSYGKVAVLLTIVGILGAGLGFLFNYF